MSAESRPPEPGGDDQIADSPAGRAAADQPPADQSPAVRPPDPLGGRHARSDETSPDDRAGHVDGQSDAAGTTVPPSTPRSTKRGKADAKPRRKAPWWELPALVGLAILIAILVKTFLVQPFYIPSESMEKTLHGCPGCAGDRILVNKIIYDFRDPHPGDIVVFDAPSGWDDEPPSVPPGNPVLRVVRGFGQLVGFVPPDGLVLVKRVIAMGGQTVKGDAQGRVSISDHGTAGPWRELKESYVYKTDADPRAKFGPITVPKGRLWVMGDHRDRSADSRYHCGQTGRDGPDNSSCNVTAATVPIGAVIGKAFVIAWPVSRWSTLGTPTTFTSASAGLAGAGVLPAGVVVPVFFLCRRRRRR